MDQNTNYITLEFSARLQMVCGARHNICYGKRWIMWSVLIIKLIVMAYTHSTQHNEPIALPARNVPSNSFSNGTSSRSQITTR